MLCEKKQEWRSFFPFFIFQAGYFNQYNKVFLIAQ